MLVFVISWITIIPSEAYLDLYQEGWVTFDEVKTLGGSMIEHSVPLLISTLNFYLLTDSIVYISDLWVVLIFSVFYLLVAYIWTIQTGKVIYSFLDFDVKSPDFWQSVILFPAMASIIHIGNALVSQLMHQQFEFSDLFSDVIAKLYK